MSIYYFNESVKGVVHDYVVILGLQQALERVHNAGSSAAVEMFIWA